MGEILLGLSCDLLDLAERPAQRRTDPKVLGPREMQRFPVDAKRQRHIALEPKLGQLLPIMAQGHWGEAESLAYQIVSLDHYNYFGNLRLAIALRMQEKIDAAYQIVVKMAQAYPTDIYFLTELAILNDAQGNTKEATRLFTDILVLDPENRDARSYLGR